MIIVRGIKKAIEKAYEAYHQDIDKGNVTVADLVYSLTNNPRGLWAVSNEPDSAKEYHLRGGQ